MKDYHYPNISVVSLQIIRGSKKFQILSFYRQWSIEKPTREERRQSAGTQSQSDRFQQICQIWDAMVDTEIETISMSDTNLSHALLTDNEDLMTDYDTSLKSIGKHFTETIAPK